MGFLIGGPSELMSDSESEEDDDDDEDESEEDDDDEDVCAYFAFFRGFLGWE